jgi:hypothetical protein
LGMLFVGITVANVSVLNEVVSREIPCQRSAAVYAKPTALIWTSSFPLLIVSGKSCNPLCSFPLYKAKVAVPLQDVAVSDSTPPIMSYFSDDMPFPSQLVSVCDA